MLHEQVNIYLLGTFNESSHLIFWLHFLSAVTLTSLCILGHPEGLWDSCWMLGPWSWGPSHCTVCGRAVQWSRVPGQAVRKKQLRREDPRRQLCEQCQVAMDTNLDRREELLLALCISLQQEETLVLSLGRASCGIEESRLSLYSAAPVMGQRVVPQQWLPWLCRGISYVGVSSQTKIVQNANYICTLSMPVCNYGRANDWYVYIYTAKLCQESSRKLTMGERIPEGMLRMSAKTLAATVPSCALPSG